jgi:hypothetical protein
MDSWSTNGVSVNRDGEGLYFEAGYMHITDIEDLIDGLRQLEANALIEIENGC